MAGTQGIGTFQIDSKFASGNLVFYEKSVGRTATGDVFTIGTAAVKVGGTAQDVDFQFYATGSLSAIIDAGAATLTLVGITSTTDKPLTISDTTESTSTITGALIVSGGIGFAKDMYVGDDIFLTSAAKLDWAAGNALLTHSTGLLTFSASDVAFGVDGTGIDVTFFGDTASHKVWFDQNGDTNGAWYFGADTKGVMTYWYGDTTLYNAHFDPSGDTNGVWYFGADDYGIDVAFYGVTATNSMIWDASANALVFVAGGITMGVASVMILPVKVAGSATAGDIWLDTNDNKLHFYNGSAEKTVTDS